ncbi:MAG: transglycosylase domain-containing protein [Oscillospiraceae bacterium]|jgi:penicillin-binding protein 1A|nr:transglycosylase domain-containing protein [Oscillospiraceae bacterium]
MAKKKTAKKRRSKGVKGLLFSLRGISFTVLALFLVGFFTATAVGAYFFVNTYATIMGSQIINLDDEKSNQKLTTIIYYYDTDAEGQQVEKEYKRLHGIENRVWIEMNLPTIESQKEFKMTPAVSEYSNIVNAYVALEDKRFWEHAGVDWRRFIGVITKYSFSQGASTLTQQLIKNITKEKDVTAVRKYNEILTALNLEHYWTKDRIIEAYLNTLYLGRGCYGVYTGAEKYFGKEVRELNLAECASLAAITKAPSGFDPLSHPEDNKKRQEYCLSEMLNQGLITQAEHDEAVAYKLIYTTSPEYKAAASEAQAAAEQQVNDYYVDYIIDTVIADLRESEEISKTQATNMVYGGGLRIYAAVDKKAQEAIEKVFRERINFPNIKATEKRPAPQASMTVMDYTGRVVALAGGADEKPGNRSLNRASASWRQPGSTIKPLAVYGPAVDQDKVTWSTLVKNAAFPYKGMAAWPQNNDGSKGSGAMVTIQYALQQSLNTVSARTLNEHLGIEASYTFIADSFGFAKLDPVNDRNLPPLATGGMTYGISTLEETAAYAMFGNGGVYYEPYCYYKVTNYDGSHVYLNTKEKQITKQAMTPGGADVMCEMLQTVPSSSWYSPTGKNVIQKFPIMAKTGTTSDNKDRWFAAGTPYYIASCWFGYDQPESLGSIKNPAANIWMEVMNRLHKDLDADKKFPKSNEAVKKSYCTRTGKTASSNCPSATGWYKLTNIPSVCTSCASTPSPAPESSAGGGNGGGGFGSWFEGIFG